MGINWGLAGAVAKVVSDSVKAVKNKSNSSSSSNNSSSSGSSNTNWTNKETGAPYWLNTQTDMASTNNGGSTSTKSAESIANDYIDDLKKAQIDANLAALDKQYSGSLSNLDQQKETIKPYYYDKRNQAAAQSDISALNFAQRAAARGITGNSASMPEIYRNNALQGQIGALDQAETASLANIESDRTSLKNSYEADIAAAKAGAEATALQNYINQMNAERDYALQEASLTGTYNGQTTVQAQQQQLANQLAQLQIEAQTIQNSYLPQTLKDEAKLLQQQVESGRVDIDTAMAKLNQIKTGNSSESRTSNSSNNSSNNSVQTAYYQEADNRLANLTIPSSKIALLQTYQQQGKLSDSEAAALSVKYGLNI
jgi:hypothetical protein